MATNKAPLLCLQVKMHVSIDGEGLQRLKKLSSSSPFPTLFKELKNAL